MFHQKGLTVNLGVLEYESVVISYNARFFFVAAIYSSRVKHDRNCSSSILVPRVWYARYSGITNYHGDSVVAIWRQAKLPGLMRNLGRSVNEFKAGIKEAPAESAIEDDSDSLD